MYKELGFKIATDELQPIFTRFHQQNYEMTYTCESAPNDKLAAFYKRHPNLHRIKVHDFRHTHTSLFFESGASLKGVQVRLGHSDIKTTMDIYTHLHTCYTNST
ncbi:tyrosine-type recombinase/integrase [Lysinibacillus piscis]|uniref:tyrosine-type recombinase/integrase n=1 Tax=Lysinibacillus piscis TaxID=2518931 RepID=UPI00222FD1D6|nr:tyrosine-type recombinase/integrase [Lysinibacillus sp. KH24]